jgi:hypothetical protein
VRRVRQGVFGYHRKDSFLGMPRFLYGKNSLSLFAQVGGVVARLEAQHHIRLARDPRSAAPVDINLYAVNLDGGGVHTRIERRIRLDAPQ